MKSNDSESKHTWSISVQEVMLTGSWIFFFFRPYIVFCSSTKETTSLHCQMTVNLLDYRQKLLEISLRLTYWRLTDEWLKADSFHKMVRCRNDQERNTYLFYLLLGIGCRILTGASEEKSSYDGSKGNLKNQRAIFLCLDCFQNCSSDGFSRNTWNLSENLKHRQSIF